MASFDSVNFYLRTNKNIKRKLIFESLAYLDPHFQTSNYRYVGFGSLWFTDYIIAHKVNGMSDLISIEKDRIGYSRAKFNKPFDCITVKRGESTRVLRRINLSRKPVFAWLDYDKSLDESAAFQDIEILATQAPSGSIFLITLDANIKQLMHFYPPRKQIIEKLTSLLDDDSLDAENKVSAAEAYLTDIGLEELDWREKALREIAGDFVPVDIDRTDIQKSGFPNLLAKITINFLRHMVNISGRDMEFVPLYNFFYKDGAPMICVGGMLADHQDAEKLKNSPILSKNYITGEDQFVINAPPITLKEKIALEQLLPTTTNFNQSRVSNELGVLIKTEQLKAFESFYPYYPLYDEIQI